MLCTICKIGCLLAILEYIERERERERFVFRQLGPSRGIRRSFIKGRRIAPSTGRFYMSSPLGAFLSITCTVSEGTSRDPTCYCQPPGPSRSLALRKSCYRRRVS